MSNATRDDGASVNVMHGTTNNATHDVGRLAHRLQEVADRLAVSKRTVYRLIERGELSAVTVGADLRILESDLVAYIERLKGGAAA